MKHELQKKETRDRFIKLRVSSSEEAAIDSRAESAGITVSNLIRQSALGGKIEFVQKAAPAHSEAAFELRRIGAMLKGAYPKNANWTNAEKRKYWDTMNLLLGLAERIEHREAGEA